MYDYNNITEALEKIYSVKPGTIISFQQPIKFLEKTSVGLWETDDAIKKIQHNFMVLKVSIMCEDWRYNIGNLFPDLHIKCHSCKEKKQLMGDIYAPVTPCTEILLNEKIYYIDIVDFFLSVLAGQARNIS